MREKVYLLLFVYFLSLIIFCLQVHKVATDFDPFRKLSGHTQEALLKHNSHKVVALYSAIYAESCRQGLNEVCS